MTVADEAPNRLPWPPIIYVGAIAAAIVLGFLLPLPWPGRPLGDILVAVGWLVGIGGLALDIQAMRTLARARTTFMPHRMSEHLVTNGPYSLTRNPIYVGNTMLMIGAGLVAGSAWFLLLAVVAGFATQKLAIEREERHLEARFGKKYRDYRKKVRRWL